MRAEGEWESDQFADLEQICSSCGEEFILTLTALDKPSDPPQTDGSTQSTVSNDASGSSPEPQTDPLDVGQQAPDFELPGVGDDGTWTYHLSDYTESGPVLLSFYPFDFSPVCERELCRFQDLEWARIVEDVDVFAISGDSTYSHRAFREANGFQFPLLTDRLANVAAAFGVRYDEWENQPAVCQRAILGIDSDRTVGYRWHTDDATEQPDFDDLESALDWAE